MLSLIVINPLVVKKRSFKFRQCSLEFFFYLPLEHGVALHLNKMVSTSTKDTLEMALCFLRRRFSYTPVVCRCIFVILLLSPVIKERGPLCEQTRVPFSQRYQICHERLELCHGFWSWSILNFVTAFLLFRYYLPFEKRLGPPLEETWTTVIQTRRMSI